MSEQVRVTQAALPPFEEYVEEIRDIWSTHWLTNMGEKHKAFAGAVKDYLKADNLELFVNGHMSLELSLQALNLSGEVITTPFTFASTTHAIVRNGLTPVFADIKPDDFTLDPVSVESLITDRTSAIMPVHVYGHVCEVEAMQRLADKYGLKLIYDAAHAFGVEVNGQGIAGFGDVSCFSFHATKVFNSIEGGAAAYRDKELGRRLYQLKNFGIRDQENVNGVGANAKMNEFAAAMGLCNLRHIEEEREGRKAVTERYKEHFAGVKGLCISAGQAGVKENYAYFPLLVEENEFGASRNEIFKALAEENIFARKYFYPLTSSFECYQGCFNPEATPVALHVSKRILTLPLYAGLPPAEIDRIAEIILRLKN